MNRREMVAGLTLCPVALPRASSPREEDRPRFAVTIDDFRIEDDPLMSGAGKHRAILDALEATGIKAGGFVAGRFVDNPAGPTHLASWSEAGHAIGNHTHAHAYYGGAAPGDLGADIDKAAALLADYPTLRPWFRFPYLAEGGTREAREAMRGVLRSRGLLNAHVTIDASDWYVDQRLRERLKTSPDADPAPYGAYLVQHLLDRAAFYDRLARDALGYSPPHTLLLHHNLITALFLPDVLAAFHAAGWQAIDADDAFAHPVFRAVPDITPVAHSLIWQLARAEGRFEARLRSPGEDGRYEKPAMDALGL